MEGYSVEWRIFLAAARCPDIHGRPTGFGTESIRHFVDCVLGDQEPMVTAQDGLKATQVVCAIEQAAKKSKPVDL